MGGTKIMVLQVREIIKTAIFVVIGIALILVLVNLFLPKADKAEEQVTSYIPGAYTVNLQLSKGAVDIEVVVNETEITKVDFSNLPEEQQVFYPLLKPTMEILSTEIIETQNLEVAVPEENTVTGQVLIYAINEALTQAKAE